MDKVGSLHPWENPLCRETSKKCHTTQSACLSPLKSFSSDRRHDVDDSGSTKPSGLDQHDFFFIARHLIEDGWLNDMPLLVYRDQSEIDTDDRLDMNGVENCGDMKALMIPVGVSKYSSKHRLLTQLLQFLWWDPRYITELQGKELGSGPELIGPGVKRLGAGPELECTGAVCSVSSSNIT
ncbi:hypothetical protein Tco_0424997 [Tanacetum coccineum]